MGSKNRFAKYILPIILDKRESLDQTYIEPFAGGMNTIDKVEGKRIANDIHFYLIEMWRKLIDGWIPGKYTKEEHKHIRENKESYDPHIVGWVGFNCSYSGVYFGGFAGETKTKTGIIRDYQSEAINNVMVQVPKMKGVVLKNKSYINLTIPEKSIIYCDPPYENTSKYKVSNFNPTEFWEWCRTKKKEGHIIYISEYNAPDDFKCVWEKDVKSSLSANGKSGGSKGSTERLFTI